MFFDNRNQRFALVVVTLIGAFGCEADQENVQVVDPTSAQNGDRLILMRRAVTSADGVSNLVQQLGGQVMTFESLVANFPATNIPESVRAGLKFLKFNSMPDLAHVTLVGSMPTFDCTKGENLAEFRCGSTDVPLYYTQTFAKWNEDPAENAIPSELPYGYLRGEWPSVVGGPYATPEIFFSDVNVGLIPLDGTSLYGIYGPSNLETYGEKLAAWVAPEVFRSSQFYSGSCPAVHDPLGKPDLTLAAYTYATPVVHECQRPGEENGGDMGTLATADGSSYAYYSYHGNIGGSCAAGGYCYDYSTNFGGIVYAFSCLTGAPDLWPTPLAEYQLRNPNGAIAYVGYARMASSANNGDPIVRAFIAGRWTLGEAMSGYRQDLADTIPSQHWYRDLLSLTLYGPPQLPIAAPPKAGIKTIAAHVNGDGTVTADVQAFGAGTHWLAIGDRVLTTIEDGEVKRVMVDAEDAKLVFHLLDCDPNKQICQAAQVRPEPKFRLDCGHLVRNPNGTLGVDVTVPVSQETSGVTARVVAIDVHSPDGVSSGVFLDSRGWRNEREFASINLSSLTVGANHLDFVAAPPTIAGYHFRALQVRLVDQSDSPIASCFVPLTETEVKSYGLDRP